MSQIQQTNKQQQQQLVSWCFEPSQPQRITSGLTTTTTTTTKTYWATQNVDGPRVDFVSDDLARQKRWFMDHSLEIFGLCNVNKTFSMSTFNQHSSASPLTQELYAFRKLKRLKHLDIVHFLMPLLLSGYSLPRETRNIRSTTAFKTALKNYLFKFYFC